MKLPSEKNPKGPDFKKSRHIEKNLSGTILKFMAPPHKDPFSASENWEQEPDQIDILNASIYKDDNRDKDINFSHSQWTRVYSSIWGFNGLPIIHGYCGDLTMLVNVIQVENLPVNTSLFENSTFSEQVFRDLDAFNARNLHEEILDDNFSSSQRKWPNYLGPLNWQWLSIDNQDWIYHENQPLVNDDLQLKFCTPIDNSHYLSLDFSIVRSARNAGNAFRIESRVGKKSFVDFINNIINSINLELAPENKTQRKKYFKSNIDQGRPIYLCSKEQIELSKHVMRMWSDNEFIDDSHSSESDSRASKEEVASFINKRVSHTLLENSYPLEEQVKLPNHNEKTFPQNKPEQACIK
ncbi:hypothetical protein [Microbulbifer sp.]|uniref:hypothetical protein n=1 Tax=Microbulbifer sp. TaxID=1908541 RepID=UPI00258696D4|nr:hypothetical protein [Microbulbifer sp.]